MRLSLTVLPIIFSILISGCASDTFRNIGLDKVAPRKAEQNLSTGIRLYEDSNYKTAAVHLQNALDEGLTFKNDQVAAHKYLGFIHCASGREKQCRDEFKKAVGLDPTFELTAAEAGHPIWGPIFRSVKSEMQIKSKPSK